MSFNLIGGLLNAGLGLLESGGNPLAAIGMGLAGGATGGVTAGNVAGAAGNAGLGALNAQNEAFQLAMYGEQIRHQESMQRQSEAFDEMMDEKAEQMREVNTLRDVQMVQRKEDNAITKKFIESIGS
jgi:hypothetical protein